MKFLYAVIAILILIGCSSRNPEPDVKEYLTGGSEKEWQSTVVTYNGQTVEASLFAKYNINGTMEERDGTFLVTANWKFEDNNKKIVVSGRKAKYGSWQDSTISVNEVVDISENSLKLKYYKIFSEDDQGYVIVEYVPMSPNEEQR